MQLPCSFRKPAEYYSNSEEILNLFARSNKNIHIKFGHTDDKLKNFKLSVLRTKNQKKIAWDSSFNTKVSASL